MATLIYFIIYLYFLSTLIFYFILMSTWIFYSFIFIACFHSCCISISTLHGASEQKTIYLRGLMKYSESESESELQMQETHWQNFSHLFLSLKSRVWKYFGLLLSYFDNFHVVNKKASLQALQKRNGRLFCLSFQLTEDVRYYYIILLINILNLTM